MEKEKKSIDLLKDKVTHTHEIYLSKVIDFANGKISKDDFLLAKKEFLANKKEVINLSKDNEEFNPHNHFAVEMNKDHIQKIVAPYLDELKEARKDGETKVRELKEAIINIQLRKNIKRDNKKELIHPLVEDLNKAKEIQKQKKNEVAELVKKVSFITKKYGEVYRYYAKVMAKHKKQEANVDYKNKLTEENKLFNSKYHELNKDERRFANAEHKQKIKEIQAELNDKVSSYKKEVHDSYLDIYSIKREILDNNLKAKDKLGFKWENYKYKFKLSSFLMKNSLYIVIIIFFIVCAVIAEIQGNPLINTRTLETIFIQSSTKVFFSLGVAGLILLGGTDLSIGRMTGMAATFSCLIMSQLVYETNIGVIDMTIPKGVAVVLAIFVCVFSTTLFSSIAGFFTSKFKMHPFITTLSTQLLIYGLMMVCFSQVPAFTMNPEIKNAITGELGWLLPIYALIAIVIIWFIWNKTKFGKNMYAVGDNKEAASVSGINVFKVTMGVFVMAGILYGLGGFLEGARVGNANPSTALGTELDAIAACVIGGISFSGGKGKVSGAVVGTIIFATLTYCLTYIGLDINYQFIFKGLIILAAVCLDSIKFLKKK